MLTDMLSCICRLRQVSKHLFIFPIQNQKKNWAKWAKWARLLKSSLNNEQLHSGTCFLVFACSNNHQYTSLLILHKIVKNKKKILFEFFVKKDWKIHNSENICRRAFCLAPNERKLSHLLTLSISFERPFVSIENISLEYVKKSKIDWLFSRSDGVFQNIISHSTVQIATLLFVLFFIGNAHLLIPYPNQHRFPPFDIGLWLFLRQSEMWLRNFSNQN